MTDPDETAVPPGRNARDGRVWVEFDDPAGSEERFRCDLTWLTSSYACIFGAGCLGIDADKPDDGCCVLGAHFTDDDDVARVRAVVDRLTPQTWQFHAEGAGDWTGTDGDDTTTRVHEGACILLNRAGFAPGAGCALHQQAQREGAPPHTFKPDVCWQLPLRRAYRNVEHPDGTSYLETTIGEYDAGSWGPGGHDFDWYCTDSPLAHAGGTPLFRGSEAELRDLMGDAAYEELAARCEAHLAGVRALTAAESHRSGTAPDGRRLLPLLVHPATLAARGGA